MRSLFLATIMALLPFRSIYADMVICCDEIRQIRGSTLFVFPDTFIHKRKAVYLNFKIIAEKYLGDTTFEIHLELPEGEQAENLSYKLVRNNEAFLAENYIERDGYDFKLFIPAFKKGDDIIFSIGWIGARPETYGANMLLTYEDGHREKRWNGKKKKRTS